LAIVVSSVLFALMHGNILQIPFALIVGMTCGYLVVRTGRIWPAMMLHFLNNFMSSLLQYAGLYTSSDAQSQQMTLVVFSVIGLVGLVSLLALFALNDSIVHRVQPRTQELAGGKRATTLLTSPALIISVVLSLALTVMSTQWGGAA